MLHNLVNQHSSALGPTLELDIEEDIPRSMASCTSTHYASILPFLLFIFFIHSLTTVSCYCHQTYIVPGLEPPTGQTPGIQPFPLEFPCVFHNRSPYRSSAFSFWSPEILWDQRLVCKGNFKTFLMFWVMLEKGRLGTWGGKENEEQGPHACSLLKLLGNGRKEMAKTPIKSSRLNPIRSCYILSPTLSVLIQILASVQFMVLWLPSLLESPIGSLVGLTYTYWNRLFLHSSGEISSDLYNT